MMANRGKILGDLIPLVIFIYLALLMLGILKTKRTLSLINDPTPVKKLIVYGGVVVFLLILIIDLFR